MELTSEQGRVLGSLVEKELTTPQGYPLTDNALLAACNQTTSRDPVVQYDTAVVRIAVRELRELGLLRTVHRPGERSDKHRHELAGALELSPAQVALLAILLLRGPQTAAELRARSERMHPFDSTEQAEDALVELMNRAEPLVVRLERRPGRKEARYAQQLAAAPGSARPGDPAPTPVPAPTSTPTPTPTLAPARLPAEGTGDGTTRDAAARTGGAADRLTELRAEMLGLRDEVAALRIEVPGLRDELAALRDELAALRDEVTRRQG